MKIKCYERRTCYILILHWFGQDMEKQVQVDQRLKRLTFMTDALTTTDTSNGKSLPKKGKSYVTCVTDVILY